MAAWGDMDGWERDERLEDSVEDTSSYDGTTDYDWDGREAGRAFWSAAGLSGAIWLLILVLIYTGWHV